jgi:hypothetical protein
MIMVRSAYQDPTNIDYLRETIKLAEILYKTNLEEWVSSVLSECTTLVPTESPESSLYLPQSFKFDSFHILEAINRYWACRIYICGLIQTLSSLTYPTCPFDIPTIHNVEIQAATNIAMSVQYALKIIPPPQPPLGALHTIMPLQTSFGAWHRCENREVENNSPELYIKAVHMKSWASKVSNDTLSMWGWFNMSMENLEQKTEAFVGGKLQPWMGKKTKGNELEYS